VRASTIHPGRRDLIGQHAVILGLARQGVALARFLAQAGAEVTVSDLRTEEDLADEIAQLDGLRIRYVLGKHSSALLKGADMLCLSGGVPVDVPIAVEALDRGIAVTNDAQVFLELCPAPVIGITGSAGKTTTTALVGEMCRVAGRRTWVGGNIGNPLISDLSEIKPSDCVVMELSSFQLELMTLSPHIAAVLNITPNHLDRHRTMDAYIAAKRNAVAYQASKDFAILGYDDANSRSLALDTAANLLWFSDGVEVDEGAFRTNGELTLRVAGADCTICEAAELKLRGRHNCLNVLAASTLCTVVEIPVQAIREVATNFKGVKHRLDLVCHYRGVDWYDDSIATAPERTLAALRSFDEPIVLLAGGRDKELPWDAFAREVVSRVSILITFGEAGPMIADIVEARQGSRREKLVGMLESVLRAGSMKDAVVLAARVAQPGNVVLLSPGGTSFDEFRDFEERGDRFKEIVRELH